MAAEIDETASAGKANPLEGYEERTQHWLLARSNLIDDGKLVYRKLEVAAVEQKVVQVSLRNKEWVSSSLIGRTTNLLQPSIPLNTLVASVLSLL